MILIKKSVFGIVLFSLLMTACEMQKTEYRDILDGEYCQGFSNGIAIVHERSISYYSPEVNKVYPNLYAHQNGNQLGNGIHSLAGGMITFQEDNYIEFVDRVNFTTEGILDIEKPRSISYLRGYYVVSFGEKKAGGIAIVDVYSKSIEKIAQTDIQAGKVYQEGDFLYVFSDGSITNDTIIEKFYYDNRSPSSLLKLDSFNIGVRPIDFVEMDIPFDGAVHSGLAILCKGDAITPASIEVFDLILEEVVQSYSFESSDMEVENLFRLWEDGHTEGETLVSYINNKLYTLTLNNPIELSLLIKENVSFLAPFEEYYLAISRDTLATTSNLYRYDQLTLDLVDSISINPKAIKWGGL